MTRKKPTPPACAGSAAQCPFPPPAPAAPLHIHMAPVMYVFRGYREPDGYERRLPYDLVGSVFDLGDGRARVFATQGELDRGAVQQLADLLREIGIRTVLVERHGVEQQWSTGRATSHPARRP